LVSLFADAAVRPATIRIKVLDSETHSVTLDDSGVPKNCDPTNYDAYCHSSKTSTVTNTLLVQEDDQPSFRVACTIESKWSRCRPLPKGESFDARREKHGITVYYVDDKGKVRGQLYTLVDRNGKAGLATTAAVVATQPVPAAVAPQQSSPVPAPAPSAGSVREVPLEKVEKVKCNFSSTPAGAEITLDGKYVGSTPSEIPVSTGAHVVIFSLPGFSDWRRELTVAAGSVVNVTASLQKTQP